MEKEKLIEYAKLIAKSGLNVQKGQDVMIEATPDQMEFLKILYEEIYKCGARKIFLKLYDPSFTLLDYKYQSIKVASKLEKIDEDWYKHIVSKKACRLFIESEDPEALKGIDIKKYSKARSKKSKKIQKYRKQFDNEVQWCIAAVPSIKWAHKVFPMIKDDNEAVEALWEAILRSSRSLIGNPIKNFDEHDINLRKKAEELNNLHIKTLHYESSNGTDFTCDLIDDVMWCGGGEETKTSKVYFQPNIPTEEIFTSPNKNTANGVLVSSKPLLLNNNLVEDFKIHFKDGKVYKVEAKKGEESLIQLLASDPNNRYLGELALIPYNSPINNSGLIFYNTLFDENASCHAALGMGFSNLLKGYENMSDEEIKEKGINDSTNHVDFMIGTKDLNITAITKEGKPIKIFENGDWSSELQ